MPWEVKPALLLGPRRSKSSKVKSTPAATTNIAELLVSATWGAVELTPGKNNEMGMPPLSCPTVSVEFSARVSNPGEIQQYIVTLT